MNKLFNADMLKIAREARRKTQVALAKDLEVSQVIISKIEAGLLAVNESFIEKISNVLKYPSSFFYENFNVLDMGVRLHRKKTSLKREDEAYIDSFASIYDMAISKFLNHIEIDIDIPNLPIEDFKNPLFNNSNEIETAPEIIAAKLREFWGIEKGPIKNLTRLIEANGVFIFEIDFPLSSFDAVSFFSKKNNCGMIIINKNFPPDRQRFTLAHELGHLIMHRACPSPTSENEANTFASEFLMPTKDIYHDLRDLNFWDLPSLKQIWKTSMAALIMKAHSTGAVNESKCQSLFVRMSQKGYRKVEPDCNLEKETPALVKNIINYFFQELAYSKKDLLALLSMNEDNFEEYFSFCEYNIKPRLSILRD
ncbi:MAG: XRE family transcriptional regulator [Candidatus Gastranaerophilales bacterium]|nr:XRE family transcriptional regulator [Candidatus Gastranaerophilales bacterium]